MPIRRPAYYVRGEVLGWGRRRLPTAPRSLARQIEVETVRAYRAWEREARLVPPPAAVTRIQVVLREREAPGPERVYWPFDL